MDPLRRVHVPVNIFVDSFIMNSQETGQYKHLQAYTDECCLPDVVMQKWKRTMNLYGARTLPLVKNMDSVLTLVLINVAMVTISDFYLSSAAGLQTFDVAIVAKGV